VKLAIDDGANLSRAGGLKRQAADGRLSARALATGRTVAPAMQHIQHQRAERRADTRPCGNERSEWGGTAAIRFLVSDSKFVSAGGTFRYELRI
jgi:hypothetical protein